MSLITLSIHFLLSNAGKQLTLFVVFLCVCVCVCLVLRNTMQLPYSTVSVVYIRYNTNTIQYCLCGIH